MCALTIRPEAVNAWHALSAALVELEDEGRQTICRTDPDPFTSEDEDERTEAAAACCACPVINACRTFADANEEPAHVWGGVDRTPRTYTRRASA